MPHFVPARLAKMKTADGLVEMLPEVELGEYYMVDLDSIKDEHYFNTEFQKEHWKQIILCDNGRWLPTELLEFPKQ